MPLHAIRAPLEEIAQPFGHLRRRRPVAATAGQAVGDQLGELRRATGRGLELGQRPGGGHVPGDLVRIPPEESLAGYELDAIIDEQFEENIWQGRTYADAPEIDGNVYVTGKNITAGDLIPVEITGCEGYDLLAVDTRDMDD